MTNYERLRALYSTELDPEVVFFGGRNGLHCLTEASSTAVRTRGRQLVVFRSAFSYALQGIIDSPTFEDLVAHLDDDGALLRVTETPAFRRLSELWVNAVEGDVSAAMKRLFDDVLANFASAPTTREALARVLAQAKEQRSAA